MKRTTYLILSLVLLAGVAAAGVVSVSSVNYESNSGFFSGQVFVIDFVADGSTDKVSAILDSGQLADASGGDVSQDLTVDATATETYARYSIGPSGEPTLVQLDLTTATKDTQADLEQWAVNTCYDPDHDGKVEWYQHSVPSWDIADYKGYCAYRNGQYGPIGDIAPADELFTAEFCAEASGKSRECATLSNGDAGAGTRTALGQHVKIEWNGNLDTGKSAPGFDDEYALHGNQFDGGWRIISYSRYDDWTDYTARLPSLYEDWATGSMSRSDLESQMDQEADQAASKFLDSPLTAATTVDSSFTDGQLRLDLANQLAYPAFTMYVDGAEYITVEKPTGVPKIVSTNSDRIGEIGGGTLSVTAKNVGEAEGSFAGRIKTCSDGFTFDSGTVTRQVNAGATTTYEFDVSFTSTGSQSEVSGTCTVEVKGVESTDTATVSVTGVQENECQPNQRFSKEGPDGREVIYLCHSDGAGYSKVKTCPQEKPETDRRNGKLVCVEEQDDSSRNPLVALSQAVDQFTADVNKFMEDPLGNFMHKPLLAIDILATLLAVVASFFLAQSKLVAPLVEVTSEASGVNETVLRFVVGVLVAVLAGYLTYTLISQLWVKLLVVVGSIVLLGAYLYILAILPG